MIFRAPSDCGTGYSHTESLVVILLSIPGLVENGGNLTGNYHRTMVSNSTKLLFYSTPITGALTMSFTFLKSKRP